MKFTAKGRKYEIDKFGVITQLDHRPFTYDKGYWGCYDKPEYKQNSDLLQALRLGFALGSHGSPIVSLLDCGYGNGAFINFAKKLIPYVYGYDVTGAPLDGAYIMPQLVECDVMTLHDVLEHFPDCSFLNDVKCKTLCVSLPYCHFHTEGLRWFEKEYKHRKPDEHIRHFNPWSLRAFMANFGWKTVAESDHENYIRKGKDDLQNILSMAFKKM